MKSDTTNDGIIKHITNNASIYVFYIVLTAHEMTFYILVLGWNVSCYENSKTIYIFKNYMAIK